MGCLLCGGERFVSCSACESGWEIIIVVDVNGCMCMLFVDLCVGC